ncbi:MAG: peptide deformylase [Proteobacteria bacterium]|nr:peptide deformylase [Pseudomonadota bacterium]
MAIMKIALMGHPVLRRRAEEITDPTAPEVKALVSHMIETMEDAEGMGLAAPQIHVSARLVIMRTPGEDDAEDGIGGDCENYGFRDGHRVWIVGTDALLAMVGMKWQP